MTKIHTKILTKIRTKILTHILTHILTKILTKILTVQAGLPPNWWQLTRETEPGYHHEEGLNGLESQGSQGGPTHI